MQGTKKESIRLFENPWLEKATHVHPIVPILFWVPVILFFIWRSLGIAQIEWFSFFFLFFVGGVTWTLAEYLLHRYAFHFDAKSKFLKRLVYMSHGIHHDQPQEKTRLLMPLIPGIALASFFYGVFFLMLGPIGVDPFFAGFLLGYLVYDYTHFAIHHFKPISPVGRYLKQHHMYHHYSYPDTRWGVSSPLWDWVFGTLEVGSKKKSDSQTQSA